MQVIIMMPTSLIYQSSVIPDNKPDNIINKDLRRRAWFTKKSKDEVCSSWTHEYFMDLREKHKLIYGKRARSLSWRCVIHQRG